MLMLPPRSTLFPYTTLFRSVVAGAVEVRVVRPDALLGVAVNVDVGPDPGEVLLAVVVLGEVHPEPVAVERRARDRKSTRLNSSHSSISYAVFCLKIKNGAGT